MLFKQKNKSFFHNTLDKPKQEFEELEKEGAKKVLKWYDFGMSSLRREIKKRPAQYFFLFLSTFLGSVITSGIALFGFSTNLLSVIVKPTEPQKTTKQVLSSASSSVSLKYDPLLLISKFRKNDIDFEIVDIRPYKEYASGHIITAKNVPVYETEIVGQNGDLNHEKIQEVFKSYTDTSKLLIIYAQNSYSTLPMDIAVLLNSEKKSVKALAIGWEEWFMLQNKRK